MNCFTKSLFDSCTQPYNRFEKQFSSPLPTCHARLQQAAHADAQTKQTASGALFPDKAQAQE
jgi:hypothetical protein